VAEWRAAFAGEAGRVVRLGVPQRFIHETTDQRHARRLCGLDAAAIAAQVEAALSGEAVPLGTVAQVNG
jgi:hypothetical protein